MKLCGIFCACSLTMAIIVSGPVLAQLTAALAVPTATAATICKYDVSATIKGEHKCLGEDEWCSPGDEREYERYGFVCRRHSAHTWLLHRRR